ncbi:hypothetical protein A6F53_01185 [Levilactobacillus brevis]|nr:hypothetical protein A6F53_01185 [Levilactobacillus brevis]ARN93683.1 hypothetical protein AZI11_12675 [Levilactobacillus brevis]ARN96259.1 hypothetical protein AZI12_12710 [Levilactobacillus brevis]
MHQKNIFVILGCCGLPFVLYDLVCLAVISYTFLTDGLAALGLFLYALLLILPVFLYVLIFFYMSIGKLIFKTLWLCGALILIVYIDYFIVRGDGLSILFIIYVLVYMSTSMVISYLLKRYVDRQ